MVCGDLIHISQPTVCNIAKKVSRALALHMQEFIKFPCSARENQIVKNSFENLGRIRNASGLKNQEPLTALILKL